MTLKLQDPQNFGHQRFWCVLFVFLLLGGCGSRSYQGMSPSLENSSETEAEVCVPRRDGSGCGGAAAPNGPSAGTDNGTAPSVCLDPNTVATPADVTDVFLMAGQSNALGENTISDPITDAPHNHVLVWTLDNRWEIADLRTLMWHVNFHPGGKDSNDQAFQVAKKMAERDPCRVVAFIPTSLPGAPISSWYDPALSFPPDYYQSVAQKTQEALAALPGKTSVDLITWIQGESDDGRLEYFSELRSLINQFRQEPWFPQESLFIASQLKPETPGDQLNFNTINEQIAQLDSDNDPRTHYTSNQGITTRDGVHFDARSLRLVGDRLAAKYLEFTQNHN